MSTASTIITAFATSFIINAAITVKHQQKILAQYSTDEHKTITERKTK